MSENNELTIEILPDSDAESPREWSNVGIVVINSRCRYTFADKYMGDDEIKKIANDKNNIVLPVYLYDHSGIMINTTGFSCPWDSGQVGIIYCTKQQAVAEWGKKSCTKKVREVALKYMNGEIETLDQYLRGDVYGYVLKNADGDVIDSCWGYYGEEEAMKEAQSAKEYHEKAAP